MHDILELSQRLQQLETRHRRLQLLVILTGVVGAALLLMGQSPAPANERVRPLTVNQIPAPPPPADGKIRAEAFILVDPKGTERASLVTDGGGSVFLVLFDKNGKPRADIQVNNYGPSLNFYDPDAKTRLVLGSTTMVASHVSKNGVIEKNTPSSIVLFDSDGKLVWRNP